MSSDLERGDSLDFWNHCQVLAGIFNVLHLLNGLRDVDWGISVITLSNSHRFGRCYRAGMNVIYGGVRNVSWDKFSPIMEKGDRQKEKSGGPALHLGGGFFAHWRNCIPRRDSGWILKKESKRRDSDLLGGETHLYVYSHHGLGYLSNWLHSDVSLCPFYTLYVCLMPGRTEYLCPSVDC